MAKYLMNHRFLGVVFIGMLALGLWLVTAVFSQKFVDFDRVALTTSTAGLNLPAKADVKVRGVIVGQVMEAKSAGKGATLELGIRPSQIKSIPKNVTAAIVPKTLFGEKYIDLTIPQDPASTSLADGDKIEQTKLPIEVEKILNDLYPLLRTVQPAELNYTLNALAEALEGRGDKIGENFVTLDNYLKKMNPELPGLIEDIKLLATVTDTYADVTPAARRHPAQHHQDRQHAALPRGQAERLPQGPDGVLRHHQELPGRQRRQHHPPRSAQRADPGAAPPLLPGVPVPARRDRPPGPQAR